MSSSPQAPEVPTTKTATTSQSPRTRHGRAAAALPNRYNAFDMTSTSFSGIVAKEGRGAIGETARLALAIRSVAHSYFWLIRAVLSCSTLRC